MPALFFGSISTIADTSELQRRAFNDAFAAQGLDWVWDREDYRSRLGQAGGQDRIAAYAAERGETVDAAALHADKSSRFQQLLADSDVTARPGVVETLKAAKEAGFRVGIVTTTSPENVAALLSALAPAMTADDFDVVVDKTQVSAVKPDPAAYAYALSSVGEQAGDAVAVEDNPDGAAAARAAGIAVVAFANANTADADFGDVAASTESLDFASLRPLASA